MYLGVSKSQTCSVHQYKHGGLLRHKKLNENDYRKKKKRDLILNHWHYYQDSKVTIRCKRIRNNCWERTRSEGQLKHHFSSFSPRVIILFFNAKSVTV